MSTAAVIQLAAVADQDWEIRGSPEEQERDIQWSLWKSEITKYQNYSRDIQEVELSSGVMYGGKASAVLTRYGDMIDMIIVELDLVGLLPADMVDASGDPYAYTGAYYSNAIAYTILKEYELEIGGTSTQKGTRENLWTYEELFLGSGRRLRDLIGRFDYSDDVELDMIEWSKTPQKLYVPLPFYNHAFGETSLALPMVALYKHDIKVKLSFAPLSECVSSVYRNSTSDPFDLHASLPKNSETSNTIQPSDLKARLLVSYVYISERERYAFSNNPLEYVIVQDQNMTASISAGAGNTQLQIHMSHPINYFDWRARQSNWATAAGRRRYSVGFKDAFDYSMYKADATLEYGDVTDFFTSVEFKFNSHNRFPVDVSPRFFKKLTSHLYAKSEFTGYEYLWCFAEKVYLYNPTSTCNFSRIDNITIKFTHPPSMQAMDFFFHASNYNVAIVEDGMFGVQFSS